MNKTASLLAVAFVVAVAGQTSALEPQKAWMSFLKGEWKYEYSSLGSEGAALTGSVKYTMAAKRTAVVARGSDNDGAWAEIIGWQPDTKKMVLNGYGSKGNYWQAVYGGISSTRLAGTITGVLPSGQPGNGKVVIERVDDNTFEVHLKLDADSGNLVDVGRFTRVAEKK